MSRPFLTAHWRNLCNLTYAVPPERLEPLCPAGVELEVRDGESYVSLVGFDFDDTRVFGVPWPGYRAFPELNLRFYVRYEGERGVVFVREFVPKRLVAWIARTLYDEPYRRAPMASDRRVESDRLTYSLGVTFGGRRHTVRVATANRSPSVPAEDTDAHFFKEHTWGFGTNRRGRTLRYRVEHPRWAVYDLDSVRIDVDYAALYGDEWAFLNDAEPVHTLFAKGSEVAVYPPETL
jgi:hypothetical protein